MFLLPKKEANGLTEKIPTNLNASTDKTQDVGLWFVEAVVWTVGAGLELGGVAMSVVVGVGVVTALSWVFAVAGIALALIPLALYLRQCHQHGKTPEPFMLAQHLAGVLLALIVLLLMMFGFGATAVAVGAVPLLLGGVAIARR